MRHWRARWRSFLTLDFWTPRRMTTTSRSIHVSSEVQGIRVADAAVPWNASTVWVELLLHAPRGNLDRQHFTLRLPGADPVVAERVQPLGDDGRHRVVFSLDNPGKEMRADVLFRGHFLSSIEVGHLSRERFLADLRVLSAAFLARLNDQLLPAQTLVNGQWKGGVATVVLRGGASLAPLLDVGLRLRIRAVGSAPEAEDDRWQRENHVELIPTQLQGREMTAAVDLKRAGSGAGEWQLGWFAGDKLLHTLRIQSVDRKQLSESIHVVTSRFALELPDGTIKVVPQLTPTQEYRRAGPCFVLLSRLAGLASPCKFTITGRLNRPGPTPQMFELPVTLTDGPTPLMTGWLSPEELGQFEAFELRLARKLLARLMVRAIPEAHLTAEGGFTPPPNFAWTGTAEDELSARLARLLRPE